MKRASILASVFDFPIIRLSRTRSLLGLGMVTLIAILLIGLVALLLNTLLASADRTLQGLVVGFTSVIIWVMLWAPMEALLFNWISPALENRILRKRNTLHAAVGQLGMAIGILLLAFAAFYLGFVNPPGFLPPYLAQILALLIVLAGGVTIFDALWTLMFDWIPYYQKAHVLEHLAKTELRLASTI